MVSTVGRGLDPSGKLKFRRMKAPYLREYEKVKGVVLLMEEILHQLRLVVYPIILRVLYIPGGAGFLLSTVGELVI